MNSRCIYLGFAALFLSVMAAPAASVIAGDPSPNVYDPETFAPLDGGIGYTWTVQMGQTDTASMQGHVGAWSWDEDGFPATEKGWTHTSNWVALTLDKTSLLTVSLENRANVPLPTALNPFAVAGNFLTPGVSIYAGWDGDGGDHHTFNNQGNIAWAEDVTHLDHIANPNSASAIQKSWVLPAGNYTVNLGGNSPSTEALGRQGYLATFTTALAPVPEPSGATLALLALAFAGCRRNKKAAQPA